MESNAAASSRLPRFKFAIPEEIVDGMVTITPLENGSSFEFSGSDSSNRWSATGGEITLNSASATRYNLTFLLSAQGFTFAVPALEIFQGTQGAFICHPAQSEGATVSASFINDVTQQQITYGLGFRIHTPSGPIIWDPQVTFNPPDEGAGGATR